MKSNWLQELHRLFWLLLFAMVIGFMTSQFWLCLAVGCLLYIAWVFVQLKRIDDWLFDNGSNDKFAAEIPVSIGTWGDNFNNIHIGWMHKKLITKTRKAGKRYSLSARFFYVTS